MGAAVLPFIIFTVLWGGVGIVLPIIVPKGPNRGIIQVILMLTGVCCWLLYNITSKMPFYPELMYNWRLPIKSDVDGPFAHPRLKPSSTIWLCCYVAQMNPLIGPKLDKHTIMVMAKQWGNKLIE